MSQLYCQIKIGTQQKQLYSGPMPLLLLYEQFMCGCICDSGWDFVPFGVFTNNPVQVVFVENVKFMYFWLITSK